MDIDDKTRNYLTNNLGIDLDKIDDTRSIRPKTAKFPSSQFIKKTTKQPDHRPMTSQITNTTKKTTFLREINDKTYSLERLKYHVRENYLNSEDVRGWDGYCRHSWTSATTRSGGRRRD